jgi:hypothetical protein
LILFLFFRTILFFLKKKNATFAEQDDVRGERHRAGSALYGRVELEGELVTGEDGEVIDSDSTGGTFWFLWFEFRRSPNVKLDHK